MYYVYDEGEDGSAAVSSVLVERATGLVAVLLVGGVATVVAFDRLPTALRTLVLLGCAGGLGVTGLLWTGAPRGLLARSAFRIERFDAGARCERLYDSIAAYRDAGRALGWALLLSLLFRFVLVANTYAMAVGIGMDVHPVYFLVFVPIVEIALFLPVSIQGFGVRETAYAVLFGSLGTPPELAVTLGFAMQLVLGVVNNLLGGLVYLGYAVVGGERPDA